jgi:hypothetical protein
MGVDGISIQFPGKDKKENFTFIVKASGADQIAKTNTVLVQLCVASIMVYLREHKRTQQTRGDETDLSNQKRQLEMHC